MDLCTPANASQVIRAVGYSEVPIEVIVAVAVVIAVRTLAASAPSKL
jgi:hypothetical protein